MIDEETGNGSLGLQDNRSLEKHHMGADVGHNSYEIEVNIGLFTILTIVALLIVTSNVFTVLVIVFTNNLRNVTGYLMMSLATADLGVGVTTGIPLVYAIFTDTLTPAACDVMGFLSSVSWVVSVYTLMLLSLDRYVAIAYPLHYQRIISEKRCVVAAVAVWVFAVLLWLFPLCGLGSYKFNDEEATCYFDVVKHPTQWIVYMFIIFGPTTGIIGFSYSRIWRISVAQKRQQLESLPSSQTPQEPSTASKKNFKAIRTLAIIAGAFYVAWTPFVVEHIAKAAMGKLEHIPEWLEIAIYVLAVTNSFWNPIIYIGTNKLFRLSTFNLLTRCCPPARVHNQVGPSEQATVGRSATAK